MVNYARSVGIGMDYTASSKAALRWAIDNLVRAGDSIILVHVVSPKAHHSSAAMQLFADTGSPLIPLEEFREMKVSRKYGLNPDPEVLDMLHTLSMHKKVEVVAKVYWGDAREKVCGAVDHLNLDCVVVGSRGLGLLKRILLGSVSTYVVQNATCPVTVVKRNAKF